MNVIPSRLAAPQDGYSGKVGDPIKEWTGIYSTVKPI